MDWLQIFVNLILTGILLYVFQRVIDERSAKRLEMFKAELRSTSFEGEIKFSKLHEMRSAVIAELYRKLIRLREELNSLGLFLKDPELYVDIVADKALGNASEAEEEFRRYFQSNRLYIPENICNQIDAIYSQFSDAIKTSWSMSLDLRLAKMSKKAEVEYLETYNKDFLKVSAAINERIEPLLKQIESDFRGLLGS